MNRLSPILHVKLINFLYAVLGGVIVIIPLARLDKQRASSQNYVSDYTTRLKRSGLGAVFTDKDERVKAIKDMSVLDIFLSPE